MEDEELRPYEDAGEIDLEFPPRKPAVSEARRKRASRQERAEQASDEREGPLWERHEAS